VRLRSPDRIREGQRRVDNWLTSDLGGVRIERAFTGLTWENGGAGEGNRTPVTSLGSWSSTIELHPRRQDGNR
jgi:hypothetical protein